MNWTIKRAAELRPVPWRNGQGRTRDVITTLDAEGDLQWQVSIADLERDADFSFFPGCDRIFTPVHGTVPPELSINGEPFGTARFMVPVPFPGDVPTRVRVEQPSQAFNAIWQRKRHRCTVRNLTLKAGEAILPSEEGTSVLFCQSGVVSLRGTLIQPGDCALGAGEAKAPLVMEENGAVLLAWIG